jgi:hypothetical protein
MGDDIRIQKRTYMKMSEVFAITGGYMQLISTIFSMTTFLLNRINNEIQLVNSIFNFYPKKRRISLKYQLQKSPGNNSPSLIRNKQYFQKFQDDSLNDKNNTILDMSKHNLIIFNNIDNSCKSISNHKPKEQIKNNKISYNEEIKNDINISKNIISKKGKDSSNNKSLNKKKKSSHKPNKLNKIKIKDKFSLFEKTSENPDEIWKKNVKFNSFYYFCLGMFMREKEEILLFDLAISFYKQKMDIIYLFHLILLVEKIWEKEN